MDGPRHQRLVLIDAPQSDLGAGKHQTQHQRLVVDTGDQMHQKQWIRCAEPERTDLRDPAALGQTWCRPNDQADPDEHDDAVTQHRGDDVLSGERGDPAPDPQEQRTVGCRRLTPEAGHREGEHVIQAEPGRRADLVGIEAIAGYLALGQIGVDVFAVHGWCDQQWHHPHQQRAIQLAARHPAGAQRESAQHQPGQCHHHRTGGRHRQ